MIELYEQASADRDDADRKRRELTGRMERIRKSYEWGDKPEAEYRHERAEIERELAGLRSSTNRADLLAKAAAFLRDLPAAWAAANPEQRNALARLVFQSVEITDDRATAIVVNPDFAPFFVAAGKGNTPAGEPGCQGDCINEAEATGVEPAISALTGLHVRPHRTGATSDGPPGARPLPHAPRFSAGRARRRPDSVPHPLQSRSAPRLPDHGRSAHPPRSASAGPGACRDTSRSSSQISRNSAAVSGSGWHPSPAAPGSSGSP